jgi:hypothetical protein
LDSAVAGILARAQQAEATLAALNPATRKRAEIKARSAMESYIPSAELQRWIPEAM